MSNFIMKVIPEPKAGTAAVFVTNQKGNFTYIKGQGNDNYLCGTCKNIICEKVQRGQIVNIVFKCSKCSSFNVIKGT